MPDLYHLDYDYSGVSLNDGFALWQECDGHRRSIGGGYACRGEVIPGPHWSGEWVDCRGVGNHGDHIMVPVSPEARQMVRDHLLAQWVDRHGASRQQAEALYECGAWRYPDRVPDMCRAIGDAACCRAAQAWPSLYADPDDFHDWLSTYGEITATMRSGDWPRDAAVLELVCRASDQLARVSV